MLALLLLWITHISIILRIMVSKICCRIQAITKNLANSEVPMFVISLLTHNDSIQRPKRNRYVWSTLCLVLLPHTASGQLGAFYP